MVTFVWDRDAGRIVGNFDFTTSDFSTSLNVRGEFNSGVGDPNSFDCNFGDTVISNCFFAD